VWLPKVGRTPGRDASQAATTRFLLTSAEDWICSKLDAVENPELRVSLGLQAQTHLLQGHKLDIYALALSDRVKELTGRQFESIKITKSHSELTMLWVADVVPTQRPPETATVTLKTRISYAKPGFETAIHEATEGIRDAFAKHQQLNLSISYTTGLPRTWSRLWEPTIRGVLTSSGAKDLSSSQITDLHFHHKSLGESFEHWVQLTISTSLTGR